MVIMYLIKNRYKTCWNMNKFDLQEEQTKLCKIS